MAVPRRFAHPGKLLLIEGKLREGIRQLALLFAKVLAPYDSQELILGNMVAETGGRERVFRVLRRARFRRLAEIDNFSGEAAVNSR